MQEIAKKHADKLRFAIVGGVNTALDFSILFILTMLFNVPKELANFISTFVAFLFSFFANKKYTFKSTSKNLKKTVSTIYYRHTIWFMGNPNNYYYRYYTNVHKSWRK